MATRRRQARHFSTGATPQTRLRSGTRSQKARPPFWRAQALAAPVESQLRIPVRVLHQASPGLVSSRPTWPAVPLRALRRLIGCPGRCRPRRALSARPRNTPSPGEAIRAVKVVRSARSARVARSRRATVVGGAVAAVTANVGVKSRRAGGQEVAWQGELVPVRGLLDLRDEGYGFLRTSGYLPSRQGRVHLGFAGQAVRVCAAATPSRVRAVRPGRARSTRPCCGSTRFAG